MNAYSTSLPDIIINNVYDSVFVKKKKTRKKDVLVYIGVYAYTHVYLYIYH